MYPTYKVQASNSPALYPVDPSREKRARFRIQTRQNTFSFQQFMHWTLMAIVVFVLIQSGRSIISGIYQMKALRANIPVVQQYHNELSTENKILAQKIEAYSSPEGIEELARNSLNMVGKNEVLVVIH